MCSLHFIDGMPTEENPYPTKNLGYNSEKKVLSITKFSENLAFTGRNKRKRTSSPVKSYQQTNNDCNNIVNEIENEVTVPKVYPSILYFSIINGLYMNIFGSYLFFLSNGFIISILPTTDTVLILKTLLESANKLLKLEVARLRKSRFTCSCKSPVHEQLFQKDKDVHFYTGISSLSIFHKLHSFISKYVRQLWVGPKFTSTSIKRKFRTVPKHMGPPRKLNSCDQFLLMLMKLCFNSPMYDLSWFLMDL